MKTYIVKAYADEDGLPTKKAIIRAENQDEAEKIAWEMFCEYHEVGVWEKK